MGISDKSLLERSQFKSLKELVQQVYNNALDARSNRTHCLTLARFTGKLEPILREVELVTFGGTQDVAAAAIVAVMGDVINRALDLVVRAGGMGKCRAIIQADIIINEFQAITGRLSDALAAVTKFNVHLSEDVNEDVEHLQSQLHRLKYRESKKVQELSVAIRREVSQSPNAPHASLVESQKTLENLLRQVLVLAKLLDPDAENPNADQQQALQAELDDVVAQAEAARQKKLAKEEQLWHQVETALERIVFPGRYKKNWNESLEQQLASTPEPPEEFLCPISLELMTDPVIMVETAMTYDRASIEQHFASGHDNCPLSGRILVSKRMIPNYNLRSAIESWAKQNGVNLQLELMKADSGILSASNSTRMMTRESSAASAGPYDPSEEATSRSYANGDASSIPDDIKTIIGELENGRPEPARSEMLIQKICELTDKNNQARVDMRACGGINTLVKWLTEGSPRSRGMVAKALWYCARDDDNSMVIAMAGAIPLLVQLLWGGTDEGKEAAARAFWNLSTYNQFNKVEIAKAGAIPALVHLLSFGRPAGKEAAAGALRSLAVNDDNELEIVRAGAIPALVEMLSTGTDNGREVALGALHNLARTDWRSEVMSAGAVEVLQQLAVNPNVRREVQKQAGNLLKRFNTELGAA